MRFIFQRELMYKVYYWESEMGCGEFKAPSDEEALKLKPEKAVFLYTESETENGKPFKILYEKTGTY